MEIRKHYITQELYEGEMILVTTPQELDQVIYNHYKDIKYETVTNQKWSAYKDLFTEIIELNPDVDTNEIKEGTTLFMPKPIVQTTNGQIKLWD